jgi:hypothetical protein
MFGLTEARTRSPHSGRDSDSEPDSESGPGVMSQLSRCPARALARGTPPARARTAAAARARESRVRALPGTSSIITLRMPAREKPDSKSPAGRAGRLRGRVTAVHWQVDPEVTTSS